MFADLVCLRFKAAEYLCLSTLYVLNSILKILCAYFHTISILYMCLILYYYSYVLIPILSIVLWASELLVYFNALRIVSIFEYLCT